MMENTRVVPWENQFYDPDLFDAGAGDAWSDEIEPMYYNLIGEKPLKLVEFGCGTGRIILELAKQGHEIIGIDKSQKMLDTLRRKMNDLPVKIRSNISILHADLAKVDVKLKIDIALAVDDFTTHFLSEKELGNVLQKIGSCLQVGSLFATDLRPRDNEKLTQAKEPYPKNIFTYGMVHNVHTINGIRSASMKFWEDFDSESKILTSHQNYDFINSDGVVEKSVFKTLRQKLFTKEELIRIANSVGFTCVDFMTVSPTDENAGVFVFKWNGNFKSYNGQS